MKVSGAVAMADNVEAFGLTEAEIVQPEKCANQEPAKPVFFVAVGAGGSGAAPLPFRFIEHSDE